MKIQKHTFSFFNLVFFTISFLLVSYSGFSNISANRDFYAKHYLISVKDQVNSSTSQLVSEENENGTDNVAPLFTISFLELSISALNICILSPFKNQVPINAGIPVYVIVRSFRI